tara:strand:- start:1324 stop:1809 length:486 start_codon:yes stop_codon:yes gene_type:complete
MNDITAIVKDLMALSIKKKITVSTAESCTGGLISKYLTDLPGSSNFFNSSIIAYSNKAKIDLLKVNPETIKSKGAVSEDTVKEMALGLLKLTDSSIVIAVSGVMGIDKKNKNEENEKVWICWLNQEKSKTFYTELGEDRGKNRLETTKIALLGLYDFIKEI